uniref:Uncharacterized protein n=1 Tax=Arundo donax TaxID=35708 RepID=A0A0A8XS81_ARUDO
MRKAINQPQTIFLSNSKNSRSTDRKTLHDMQLKDS